MTVATPALPDAPLDPDDSARRARRRGLAFGLLAVAIWALYLALAKQGVNSGLVGMDFALLRFGTAGLLLLPWLLRHGLRDLAGVGWRRGLVLAVLAGPLFILAGVGGFQFAPLAHGAVVQPATIVIASTLLAFLVLGERAGRGRIVGIGVIVLGLATIAGPSLFSGARNVLLGDALFVVAGPLWAGFTVLTRRWNVRAWAATAAVSVLSMLAIVPIYLTTQDVSRLAALSLEALVTQVIVQGVLSGIVAVLCFTRAAELLGAGRAAVFPAMVPAAAILLGIPLAGEWPNGWQLGGLALVSAGLVIAIGVLPARRR